MLIKFITKIVVLAAALLVIPAAACLAASPVKAGVPTPVAADLQALLGLVDALQETGFESSRIPALLDFVYADKPANIRYSAGDKFNTTSAYYEFDINSDFDTFLKIAFNPDVPTYLLMPASIRRSHWKTVNGKKQPFPKLWEALPGLTEAVTVRGVEFIENTPDLNSGAYFAYDLDKLLILMKHNGCFVLLSISKQESVSQVGKKGIIIGPDTNWTYLYSGQEGITKPGLGWVSSYMYDSYSVAVYAQLQKDRPGVRCGTFKWINAGWSRINMVKQDHIHQGLLRYAQTFKEIIEHPVLPAANQIAQIYSRIRDYSLAQLQTKFYDYLTTLETRHRADDSFPTKWFREWFKSKDYLKQLKKEELESVLIVEFIKQSLGRESQIKIGELLGDAHPTPSLPDRLAMGPGF